MPSVENEPERVKKGIARALERLKLAVDAQTPAQEAESNRRMRDIEACQRAQHTGIDVNLGKVMVESVSEAVERAGTEEDVTWIGCKVIADHVLRPYGARPNDGQISSLVEAAKQYGSEYLEEAAREFLSEPHDPRVRNPLAVVLKRAALAAGGSR